MSAPDKWLEFSVRDLDGAEVLFEKGRYHLACYLSQQAAEKSLKAFLAKRLTNVPKLHELNELCKRCIEIDDSFQIVSGHCQNLNVFFNPVRYPDAEPGILPEGFPTRDQTETALKQTRELMEFIRQRLTPPTATK